MRFSTPDPLAEERPGLSPYIYCNSNPIMLIDPSGKRPYEYEGALMSGAVYRDKKDGYPNKYIQALKKRNWYLSKSLNSLPAMKAPGGSRLQMAVFERTTSGKTEIAIAFAGTDSFIDGVDDLLQLFGLSGQYYQGALIANKLVKNLKTKDITFVGHSMGGGIAPWQVILQVFLQ